MPDPRSSAAAYATAADLTARYDARTVAELASDTGDALDAGDLSSSGRVEACLMDASGLVEMSAAVGGAYSPDDLAALTGIGRAILKRLVCALAMAWLFSARPDRGDETPGGMKWAEDTLEQIRSGHRVFGLAAQQDAGQVSSRVETPDDVTRRRGVVVEAQRLFSRRNNRLGGPGTGAPDNRFP